MNENNISEIIDKLLIIQERDVRIMRYQREIDQIPLQSKKIEGEIAQVQALVQNAKNNSKTQQSEVKKIELEIDSFRQKIAKLREQQYQIKSNEEFKVLNNEISLFNGEIKKMEDKEMAFMELVEKAQQMENKAQKDLAAMQATIQSRLLALSERKNNLDAEVLKVKSDRDNIAKDVGKDMLAVYNRIFENKCDQALVAAENSTCAGCHMHLPPHVICEIKKRKGLVTCSFCGRILYLVH
jgi:hypothetical protein